MVLCNEKLTLILISSMFLFAFIKPYDYLFNVVIELFYYSFYYFPFAIYFTLSITYLNIRFDLLNEICFPVLNIFGVFGY